MHAVLGVIKMLDLKMFALHNHWMAADAVKVVVGAPTMSSDEEQQFKHRLGEEMFVVASVASQMYRLTVWYALLYVVVEGYRDLRLESAEIDGLLAEEEYVDLLRRFRNAVFHYQEDSLSPKLLDFLSREGSEKWIHKLHAAFDRYFESVFPIRQQLEQWEQTYSQHKARSRPDPTH